MTDGTPNRRVDDRRRADRRGTRTSELDAWWTGGDTRILMAPDGDDPRAVFSPANGEGLSTFQRIYRLFVGARAALALALVASQAAGSLLGVRAPLVLLLVSIGYAVQALLLWVLPRFRARRASDLTPSLSRKQWLATIVFDVGVFATLHLLAPNAGLNYVALMALPVLMAGVLTPRIVALGTAAAVVLFLLVVAGFGNDVPAAMTQAGLAGIGLFVVTLLAGELAGRLASEELSARGSLEMARQQAQLNRLVIEQMAEGVLVVDRRLHVRAANPAARRLLVADGVAPPAPFSLDGAPAWSAVADRVREAFARGGWPEGQQDAVLRFADGPARTLRLRARFTGRRAADGATDADGRAREELCVLFLEDLRSLEARNRQEKLAAMGRVSAGIAHEIRNPLAAISQANALLEEDVVAPDQQRLIRIVADNAERLKRIVEDVLEVAPGGEANRRVIDATLEVKSAVDDWARTARLPLGASSRLALALPSEPLGVVFDPEHLRRVLVNLLDNAHRHASAAPGAVRLALARHGEAHARLVVASDGEPIPPEVERHLFEPFFSTRSRGTGLGLYICRELCERYGASMDYRLRPEGQANRNEFQVLMRLEALASVEAKIF